MWIRIPDEDGTDVLLNLDRILRIRQHSQDTVSTLEVNDGTSLHSTLSLDELENKIVEEEKRLADLTKTAR